MDMISHAIPSVNTWDPRLSNTTISRFCSENLHCRPDPIWPFSTAIFPPRTKMGQKLAEASTLTPKTHAPVFFWYLPKTQNSIVVEVNYHQGTLLALPSMESSPAGQPARSNSIGVSQICVESGRVLSHISKTAAVCIQLKQTCNRQSETGTFTVSSVCLEECLADEKCFASGDECSYQGLVKHPFFKDQAISAKGWIPKLSKDVAYTYNIHKYLHMTNSTESSFQQRNYSQQ